MTMCVNYYLKEKTLLNNHDNIRTCTKIKNNVSSGGELKEVLRTVKINSNEVTNITCH